MSISEKNKIRLDKKRKQLLTENVSDNIFFILEDDPLRTSLFKAFSKKFANKYELVIYDNVLYAKEFIKKYYNIIKVYSLDYNVNGEEKGDVVAWEMALHGNIGNNVFIHSDDPDGQDEIKKILPYAKIATPEIVCKTIFSNY